MKKKKLTLLIVPAVILFVSNLFLFLVSQNIVYAKAGCAPNKPCSEIYYCWYDAEAECEGYCDPNDCERVYLIEMPHCDMECNCWSHWELICEGGGFTDYWCWEYDLWDCWREQ